MIPDGPVLVVEPHADDAYLSLHAHLVEWLADGRGVTIVTVFSGTPRRGDEAAAYAQHIGAEWYGLGLVEQGAGINGPDYPGEALDGLEMALEGVSDGSTRILPLGTRHPEHRLVRRVARAGDLLYVEIPYQLTIASNDVLTDLLHGRRIRSWRRTRASKYAVGPRIFRTQAKFFHFNPPDKMRSGVEILVE